MDANMVVALLMAVLVALVGGMVWLGEQRPVWRGHPWGKLAVANDLTSGVHETGRVSYKLTSALSFRHALVKLGATDSVLVTAASGERPIGICTDEGAAADRVSVTLLGAASGTHLVRAGAAIAQGALLVANNAGKAITLPTTPGNYWVFGQAVDAAGAADEVVEAVCFAPYLVVVGPATARTAQAALTLAHTVVRQGTAAGQVNVCAATEAPIGVIAGAVAQDAACTLQPLDGRVLSVVAAGAIVVGASVYTAASGKVQARPTPSTTATTVTAIGVALTAAASDGDVIVIQTQGPVPSYLQSNS